MDIMMLIYYKKQLKIKYDLISISVKVEEDGYWYYSARRADNLYGIINRSGEVVVKIK